MSSEFNDNAAPKSVQHMNDIVLNQEPSDAIFSEYSVDVSIEPNHECEILEIKYDGQEIYKEYFDPKFLWIIHIFKHNCWLKRPLNYSENLAELINKIDFLSEIKDEKEVESNKEVIESTDNDADSSTASLSRKFYQNVYEKLKYFIF